MLLLRPRALRANLKASEPITMTGDRMLPALETLITLLPDLPCWRRARRSAAQHRVVAAAAPSPRPTARVARPRALHRSPGSPAWPWDGSVDDRVGLSGQEAVDQVGPRHRFGLGATIALELGPNASK